MRLVHTSRYPVAGWVVALAGVCLLLTGPFLPWVVSGDATHNLYSASGTAQRLILHGHHPLLMWSIAAFGPALMVPVIMTACRVQRTAAVSALLLAGLSLIAGIATLSASMAHPVPLITISRIGPSAMVLGGLLLAIGSVMTLRSIHGKL